MPWQAIESPSLPIGLLRSACVSSGLERPHTYHGGLRWTEFLIEASAGEIGAAEYIEIAESGLFHGLGDWVFSGVLHGDSEFGFATLQDYAADRDLDISLAMRMRAHAEEFVALAASEILSSGCNVIGFSTTFMQNVASLAVAQQIKQRAHHVAIVFGGGNCDGSMGAALQRNYPFVDYVVRGEGEEAFPKLIRALDGDGSPTGIAGLCWWDGAVQRVNPTEPHPLPPGRIPEPDFDDWFDHIDGSVVRKYVEPKLVIETARGCWWGEAHQCTFCGLNGTLMEFRSKPADRVLDELTRLVARHQVLDVIAVDNIIDNSYFRTVLPKIAELGWDLRLHYEVKSNLKKEDIQALRAASVAHVQPGIESLISRILSIMDKGVSGIRNVRTLRDCESAQLTVSWNWLYGFPDETAGDYEEVLPQLPALSHLQPPVAASRILLERFSPYFENPALGFPDRTSAELYRHVYRLPEHDVFDMVYLFDTQGRGLTDAEAWPLQEQVNAWNELYPESTLRRIEVEDAIVLQDRRANWPQEDLVLGDPDLIAAYLELEKGRTPNAILRRLLASGRSLTPEKLHRFLSTLLERGLLFTEGGSYLAIATTAFPVKIE
ncbi:RiPP maturation radical SAM C-methyltransferase [Amycolatopsis sp. NPDC054798]